MPRIFGLTATSVFLIFVVASAAAQVQPSAHAVAQLSRAAVVLGANQQVFNDAVVQGMFTPADLGNKAWSFTEKFSKQGEYRFEADDLAMVSGHGRPTRRRGSSVERLQPHVLQNQFSPALTARWLLDRIADTTCAFITVATSPRTRVESACGADAFTQQSTYQAWELNNFTGLPVRLEYRVSDERNMLRVISMSAEFSDYRPVNGLLIPFHTTFTLNGNVIGSTVFSSVALNVGIAPSEFDPFVAEVN